ncbi:lycopene beta-cyclase CrtY [Halomonas sp. PAMB 3264]|uniref:lycopene beta-cyclase CrtY n=1 Tax=Halomonas sp. PAMB 3264 TaxID=3075222 RepID=UPI002898C87B|nr:lycopene beta-cyclase CrtY [Halomonas sp. PAMB 3264]WNL41715.1 lycopene beta-cyclase CrtY [Halomonas sp. PAMB 3264]
MKQSYDLILVGAGLANALIAWRLGKRHPNLDVLVIESGSRPGGNHTWSFHQHDLSSEQHAWIEPFVAHRWPGYEVRFPAFSRHLKSDYLSVTAERFAKVLEDDLGERLLTDTRVATVTPTGVTLEDGTALTAAAVIDGRGPQASPHLTIGYQSFLGQQWRIKTPHGLTRPIMMDATVDQQGGYRFVYSLPLDDRTLLIEDTHYVDAADLDPALARDNLAAYAERQGWALETLEREEHGHLPITLDGDIDAFWLAAQNQPRSGLRAGLFHATTGYSLPHAVALADEIAAQTHFDAASLFELIEDFARRRWRQQRFFRMLNRMLFLAGQPGRRWQVMQRFYTLNDGLIERFYAGRPTLLDKVRIVSGKPPVPVREAIPAVLKQTPRLRAFKDE